MLYHNYYFKSMQPLKNIIFKNESFTYELSNSGKYFIRLIGLKWVYMKRPNFFSEVIFSQKATFSGQNFYQAATY